MKVSDITRGKLEYRRALRAHGGRGPNEIEAELKADGWAPVEKDNGFLVSDLARLNADRFEFRRIEFGSFNGELWARLEPTSTQSKEGR